MEPDKTTTMGDDDAARTLKPFHFVLVSFALHRLVDERLPS